MLAISVVCPVPTLTLRRFSFLLPPIVNDVKLLIDVEYVRMANAGLTQLILLRVTLVSISR